MQDDFRSAISEWHRSWGTLTSQYSLIDVQLSVLTSLGTPGLKASLLLTYEFLRLYVNAFAFQATISRSIIANEDEFGGPYRQLPLINMATPDARFIYESVEAAKSLLTTLNNFLDAEQCLRYMPSRYYLFVVYSAVFLYKVGFGNKLKKTSADDLPGLVDGYDESPRKVWSKAHDSRCNLAPAKG